jgi:starvation-inducible DNA-binding protein
MSNVKEVLNKIVATQGVLYIRLHQFHWYVKGPHFLTLHEQWESNYDDVTADLDTVAERLVQLGGEPYSTLTEFVENSVVEENPEDKNLTAREMVEAHIADMKTYRNLLLEGQEIADEAGDEPTNDIFIDIQSRLDTNLWFFEAMLEE